MNHEEFARALQDDLDFPPPDQAYHQPMIFPGDNQGYPSATYSSNVPAQLEAIGIDENFPRGEAIAYSRDGQHLSQGIYAFPPTLFLDEFESLVGGHSRAEYGGVDTHDFNRTSIPYIAPRHIGTAPLAPAFQYQYATLPRLAPTYPTTNDFNNEPLPVPAYQSARIPAVHSLSHFNPPNAHSNGLDLMTSVSTHEMQHPNTTKSRSNQSKAQTYKPKASAAKGPQTKGTPRQRGKKDEIGSSHIATVFVDDDGENNGVASDWTAAAGGSGEANTDEVEKTPMPKVRDWTLPTVPDWPLPEVPGSPLPQMREELTSEALSQQDWTQEEIDPRNVTQLQQPEGELGPNVLANGIAVQTTNKRATKKTKREAHPYEGLTTPQAILDKFHEICKASKEDYKTGAMEVIDGQLYTFELAGQRPVPARYLYDYVCEVSNHQDLQKGSQSETYHEERLQASDPYLPNDFTAFLPSQSDWTKIRHAGRPEILYQYRCTDDRIQYSPLRRRLQLEEVMHLDNGTVLLSADGQPIRRFQHIPVTICSKGLLAYQSVAIQRLNAAIGYPDFLGRMAPALKQYKDKWVDGRMTKQAFNMAQVRIRNEMRIIPWPETRGIPQTVYQRAIEEELSDVDKASNTTRNLEDLSDAKQDLLAIISTGKKFNRAGGRKLDDGKRLEGLKRGLKTLQDLKKGENSDMLKEAIKEQEEKIKQFEEGSLPHLEAKKKATTKEPPTSTTLKGVAARPSNTTTTASLTGTSGAGSGSSSSLLAQQGLDMAADQHSADLGENFFGSVFDFNDLHARAGPEPEESGPEVKAAFAMAARSISHARPQFGASDSSLLLKRKRDISDDSGTANHSTRKRQRDSDDGEPSITNQLRKTTTRPGALSFPNVPASTYAPGFVHNPALLYAASPLNVVSFPSSPKKRKRLCDEDDDIALHPIQKQSKNRP